MGYWKNLQVFCRAYNEGKRRESDCLDPYSRLAQDLYSAHQRGLPWKVPKAPEIEDDRDLTWEEIDRLTGGMPGVHHTPCPYCAPEKELSTRFKIERTLDRARWYCFYCRARGSVENRAGKDYSPDQLIAAQELQAEKQADTRSYALRLWDEAVPITAGSSADVYLKARGVEPPPNPDTVMRWHPRCPFGKRGRVGCIVSLFRDAVSDAPTGIHRTHLYSASHGKAERMALGTIAGSAIKLWPLNGGVELAVGEGIETVLAAVKLGEARPPAWAVSVAGSLTRLPLIDGVRHLTILADNDANNVSQQAATELYHTYNRDGRDAVIKHPRDVDTDFNDLLRKGVDR
jgi:hypothetical protein